MLGLSGLTGCSVSGILGDLGILGFRVEASPRALQGFNSSGRRLIGFAQDAGGLLCELSLGRQIAL